MEDTFIQEVQMESQMRSLPHELLQHIVYFEQLWKTIAIVLSQHSEENQQIANNLISNLLQTPPNSDLINQYLNALLTSPNEALEAYKSSLSPQEETPIITAD